MGQNFHEENCRGRCFKGENLKGANFSNIDIRGANFSGANLTGANFSHATAGLQKRWVIFLVLVWFLISEISGFFSAFTGMFIGYTVQQSVVAHPFVIWIILIIVTGAFIIIIREGLNSALILAVIIAFTIAGTFAGALAFPAGTFAVFGILAVAGLFALGITGVFVLAIAITATRVFRLVTVLFLSFFLDIPLTLTLARIIKGNLIGGFIGITILILLSIYIAWRTIQGDKKYILVQNIAIAIATIGGTSFRDATLTDVNFTRAVLKNTDFRRANLSRTCFHKTQKFDMVRTGKTYLQNTQLRQVLVNPETGQNHNFDRQNLRGVNLQDANLQDASFIGADLSEANLQNANLSRAKLVQTQLDGTDFTDATITGAYIQDWGITNTTNLSGVKCEYVYMRLPTNENPNPLRKPDKNQEFFADGDFGDFIKPIFDTLDLYHNQGVDPRAIAISFKQLAEKHPEADLRIVGMEVRGENNFLLRAKTADSANKSELSAEYFTTYNQLKRLPEREIQLLLAEKDSQICRLENMVMTALERPSFYAQNYHNQGDTMSQSPKKQSNFNLQGAQFAGGLVDAETVNAHQIGGNITNYTPEQKQNLAEAAAEIQQLLNQLEQTYPTTTTSEKMSVVARAVDKIENNPTLKARVIGALKAGGTEAFKELIDNPLINILLASIEGWQDAE
jgi:uncharacterized protein YjbI with pentapeptide repeats